MRQSAAAETSGLTNVPACVPQGARCGPNASDPTRNPWPRAPVAYGPLARHDRSRDCRSPETGECGGRAQSRPPFAFSANDLNSASGAPVWATPPLSPNSASSRAVTSAKRRSHSAAATTFARSAAACSRSSTAPSTAAWSGRSPTCSPAHNASAASARNSSTPSSSPASASRIASAITEGRSSSSGRHPVAGHSRMCGARSAGSASFVRIAARYSSNRPAAARPVREPAACASNRARCASSSRLS